MPKPAHTKVVFEGVRGTVAAPLERWAFGVNFPADAIPTTGSDIVDDAIAAECATAYNDAWFTAMNTDTILTRVKVSRVSAAGTIALRGDGSLVQGEWTGSLPGETSPMSNPLQLAICVSLQTLRSGATGKGRFFIPMIAASVDAESKLLPTVNQISIANRAKDMLNDLSTILTFPPQVVSSKGYMTEVTSVRVGRVVDTLRSRREDLPEEYYSVPLA